MFKPTGTVNLWEATRPSQTATLFKTGTSWSLTFGEDGHRVLFGERFDLNGGMFYRVESITDDIGNITSIGYNDINDNLIRQITDASGRWLKLHYNDMGTATQVGDVLHTRLINSSQANQWHEVILTPGKEYRFLAYYQGNSYRQKNKLLIAELEFYDENNVKITSGTPYGSTPLESAATGPEKAFDGNIATFYSYFYLKGGYVGLDLGAGNKKKVSKIRFHIKSPINDDADITFVGQNAEAIPNWVVSHVEGSDGREIHYSYNVMTDSSGFFQWSRLTRAHYPDGLEANYTYTQLHDFNMPSLLTATDPRFAGAVKEVRYQFSPNTIIGFVRTEINNATGAAVTDIKWGPDEHTPKLVYPNGRVTKSSFVEGRLTKLTDSHGYSKKYTYASSGLGHLATMTDELNRTTTYTRGWKGRLFGILYPDGRNVTYTRDNFNRPLTINESGRATTHTYDTLGRRTRTDHPDTTFETWTYNSYGQPLTHRQRNGVSEAWAYDSSGLKKSHTDAIGAITTYLYYGDPGYPASTDNNIAVNVTARLAAMVDAHGNTTTFRYNDRGQITRQIRSPGSNILHGGIPVQDTTGDFTNTTDNTYDAYGNLISRAVNTNDPSTTGRLWIYEYDSLNRLIREQDPLLRETKYAYDLVPGGCGCDTAAQPVQITHPDNTITRHTYDKEWRLLTTTHAFGTAQAATTTHTYDAAGQRRSTTDPLGHITRWNYDAAGRVTSETRAFGTALASTASHTYDVHGNRLTSTDPIGAVTRSSYDVMDRPLTITRAHGTALATTSTYTYQPTTGRLLSVTDNISRTTSFTYDALDRVIRTDRPDGNFTQSFHDLLGRNYRNRDLLGNLPSRLFDSEGQSIASTDAAGVTTTAAYDGHGNLRFTSLPSGKSVEYQHDTMGNVIKTLLAPGTAEQTVISEIFSRDAMLRPLIVKDGEGKTTTMTYDSLGRTLTTKDALNNTTIYTYDIEGQLLTTKAADFIIVSTRTYDALHRLKTEKDGKNQTITYNYDAGGRMTSYVDAKGATFSFQYNLLHRLTRRTEPDNTFQTYTYDAAQRLLVHTKADGKTKTHHYENPLRDDLTKITYSNGEPQRTYTYTAFGQLLTAANAHSTVTTGYDTAGRKTSETQALAGGPTGSFVYQYDIDGNLARHTRPDGSEVDYAWNARNLLSSVTADDSPAVATYTYNLRNQIDSTVVEGGLFTATRSYDNAGRLTGVGNGSLDTTAYTLSPDGRRTGIIRSGGIPAPTTETYGYDNARQVSSATYGGLSTTQSWNYDAAGNRSSATTNSVTTTYLANLVNEYTSITGAPAPPLYDDNGNAVSYPVKPVGSSTLVHRS